MESHKHKIIMDMGGLKKVWSQVQNLPGGAVIIVVLTAGATEPCATGTGEGVHVVMADAVVLTRVWCTLIDVVLTVTTSEATNALALVVTNEVQACPTIEAGVWKEAGS